MKTFSFLLVLALLTPTLWAQTIPPPAETDFKSDICAVCKMAVTSKSYAAQIVTDGKPVFFDDIGCLVQYQRGGQLKPEAIQARYVRSVAADAWLLADKAIWVSTKDVRTPMGYGFHAFADLMAANQFVKTHKMAKIVAWGDVVRDVPGSMKMDDMGKM